MSIHQTPKLLDKVKEVMRVKRYSIHTERNYCSWIVQFVKFHKLNSKAQLLVGAEEKIEAFLTDLAVQRNVASNI